jgi:hypothetical protein
MNLMDGAVGEYPALVGDVEVRMSELRVGRLVLPAVVAAAALETAAGGPAALPATRCFSTSLSFTPRDPE